jgi:molybdopterin-synthase adenylyltransferase
LNEELRERIRQAAVAGTKVAVLPLLKTRELAAAYGVSIRDVEIEAIEVQALPARYERSFGTVGWEGQARLLRSTVAVIGAGGLGGYVIEGLARMGVGRLIVVDGDVFEEHNLNRQLLSTEASLGRPKVEVAGERARAINSAVEVVAHYTMATDDNLDSLLAGADVVVDALDSLPSRFAVERAARRLNIPMVHGAIAGYMAQVMTILPGDVGLERIYGSGPAPDKGVEMVLGNPAATPMLCAAWQAQEVIKLLLGVGEPLRNRMLYLDAEFGSADFITWEPCERERDE